MRSGPDVSKPDRDPSDQPPWPAGRIRRPRRAFGNAHPTDITEVRRLIVLLVGINPTLPPGAYFGERSAAPALWRTANRYRRRARTRRLVLQLQAVLCYRYPKQW
ncbi:hypothetical protein MSIMFB_04469 [Mycobacterium simulans]|uniref:Uncharacterized protein n=1 Tax=Mycobacterium simulans TaxID=627089 RepID=A0A7Z7NCD3_9MYCO|nr:hypothetical protein MSIMFB_04469 [Mycobacterium simulans]